MKTNTIIWIVIVIVIALAGWYFLGGSASAPQGSSATTGSNSSGVIQQPMEDGAEGVVIGSNLALGTSGNTTLGTYLIGYNGMTVYTKSGDSATASTCYGDCAKDWPPYVVGAEDNVNQLKAGVTGKADTFIRTDGSIQLTYNGHPLYFYIGDKTSADATGNGVDGVWVVAKP